MLKNAAPQTAKPMPMAPETAAHRSSPAFAVPAPTDVK
jgi:hypothetical protein